MVNIGRKQLPGVVEVNKSFVGGVEYGSKRGRSSSKGIVMIAVGINGPKGFGRVQMRHISDSSGESLLPFVCDVIAHGSVVRTDRWIGYNGLPDNGFLRKIVVPASSGKSGACLDAGSSSNYKFE